MFYFIIYLIGLIILLHIVGIAHVTDQRKTGSYPDYSGLYFAAFIWPFSLPFGIIIGVICLMVLGFWLWLNFLYSKITGEKWLS